MFMMKADVTAENRPAYAITKKKKKRKKKRKKISVVTS